ncbi:uncharacterized protein LOC114751122 [Neltuma alba]|uniref:uncharacterized protein LOC114751122 n=1 Tax=Neltuma alba TaxID=207710 RepID=UPI0010A434AC|nr:uncharacterized protein LOC114751122 [Prosopis alba]
MESVVDEGGPNVGIRKITWKSGGERRAVGSCRDLNSDSVIEAEKFDFLDARLISIYRKRNDMNWIKKQKAARDKKKDMASEGASGSKPAHNGWLLFRREYLATLGNSDIRGKQKRDVVSRAWRALSDEERKRYTEEVKKRRPEKIEEEKTKKYVPSFLT